MSIVELRRNTMRVSTKGNELTAEEKTMIYYLINLILLQ